MSRLINCRFSARLLTPTNTHNKLSSRFSRAPALRSSPAAVKNGTSYATPLADLCPVRNAYPLETLPKGLRPLAPARVSPVFRTALCSVCADQGAFHSRCAPLQALGDSPPLAVATPAGVGLGQGVVVSNYTAPIQEQQQRRITDEEASEIHPPCRRQHPNQQQPEHRPRRHRHAAEAADRERSNRGQCTTPDRD